MRRLAVFCAFALFAIFAVGDFVNDFVANEPIRYFAVQPLRLLLVAAIAVIGGLICLVFYRLSPRWQHKVELFAIGSSAICLTVVAGSLLYEIAGLSLQLGVLPGIVFIKGIACSFGGAALLWVVFYRVSKKRVI